MAVLSVSRQHCSCGFCGQFLWTDLVCFICFAFFTKGFSDNAKRMCECVCECVCVCVYVCFSVCVCVCVSDLSIIIIIFFSSSSSSSSSSIKIVLQIGVELYFALGM